MRATRPDVEVLGDNERDLNYMPSLPIRVGRHTMARSGECLGMSEHHAVWRFGYRIGSERHIQTGVKMAQAFLWVLADRRTGEVKEQWQGIAVELPDSFRRVLDWGD